VFIPVLILIFLQNLPSPKSITLSQIPQTTKIYDRNRILLYQIYATQNRTIVPLSDIPKSLKDATIAIEDKDFYKHPGFDILAIIRSVIKNLSGNNLQGGSTITQQLIKSALLTPEATIERKIKEVVLAFWAERIYSKNEVLELYFNQIPYGGTAWGVEAASQIYFEKHVKDLTLAESAFLAGLPRAPTIYSPFGTTPNLWKSRQKEVLERMVSLGYITKSMALQASEEELVFQTPQIPIRAPHFVMYTKDLLVKKYGLAMVEKGGLTIITSLDTKLQENVRNIVAEEVENNAYLNLTNGAALVTNPSTGDILAMIGSKNYEDPNGGNVNVTTSLRQPGSSIKVVTYSSALSNGFTAATILDDSPVVYRTSGSAPYAPVNYDGKFHGRVSLRIAFANSFNVPAVKTLNQIGIPTMISYGKKMGITTWNNPQNYGLSITLGGAEVKMLDMAAVYGVLANGGIKADLNPILKVTDYKGDILEEKQNNKDFGKQVLDSGVAFIISSILSDNRARALEFGTNSPLNIPNRTVSVKTGTSDNKRDNWTIGYTPSYVVAAWVGNNDNTPMSQQLASGITGAAPIWNKIMTHLLKDKPDEKLPMPFNVIQKPCIGRVEYFIKGTEKLVNCAFLPSPSPTP
ncbi:MAG: PBP1A family penicillin-binding protein, partial [bacterium]|nr:PBP1A family penicillin-binding protein [bacterium]